jgi:hypothetical protein
VKHFAELAATTIGVKANVALALARGFPLQNDCDQWLAVERLSITLDALASPLHRVVRG